MKLQEQPNMHLTFAKTAKMHKTLLCDRLGCLGLDLVGLGCFWVVFFLGGGLLGWVGSGWFRFGIGEMLLDTPAVQLNLLCLIQ